MITPNKEIKLEVGCKVVADDVPVELAAFDVALPISEVGAASFVTVAVGEGSLSTDAVEVSATVELSTPSAELLLALLTRLLASAQTSRMPFTAAGTSDELRNWV